MSNYSILLARIFPPWTRRDRVVGLIPAAIAFLAYLSTLSHSIQVEDGGELAAVFHTLGIAHPTGYPTLTLVAWIFSHLPLGESVVWRLNLLMALMASAAVYCSYRLFVWLLSTSGETLFGRASVRPIALPWVKVLAATSALTLAFSRTFWSEALSVEVYAFHLFFLSLVTGLFLKALSQHVEANPQARRSWMLFAFVLGLSFTNHMMTVLLAPAFLILHFKTFGMGRTGWIKILVAAPPFLLGLTPYLYLPIRAASDPWMNWGNPESMSALWTHLTAEQFRYQMFSSLDTAWTKLIGFLKAFPSEFGYLPLAFAAAGFFALAKTGRNLLLFVGLLFATCLFYTVNYAFDDPNFYSNAYFAVTILIVFGMAALLRFSPKAACLLFLIPLFPLAFNYQTVDQSRNFAVEDYARNILASLDSNATLLVGDWENFYPASNYLQVVEGLRPDVVVLSTSLMKFPWYYHQLAVRSPDIHRSAQVEVDAFLRQAEGFYGGKSTGAEDTVRFETALQAVVQAVAWNNASTRPIYVVNELVGGLDPSVVHHVPEGLVARLAPDSGLQAPKAIRYRYRPLIKPGKQTEDIRRQYAIAYLNLGLYWVSQGDLAVAKAYATEARSTAPDDAEVFTWSSRILTAKIQ